MKKGSIFVRLKQLRGRKSLIRLFVFCAFHAFYAFMRVKFSHKKDKEV